MCIYIKSLYFYQSVEKLWSIKIRWYILAHALAVRRRSPVAYRLVLDKYKLGRDGAGAAREYVILQSAEWEWYDPHFTAEPFKRTATPAATPLHFYETLLCVRSRFAPHLQTVRLRASHIFKGFIYHILTPFHILLLFLDLLLSCVCVRWQNSNRATMLAVDVSMHRGSCSAECGVGKTLRGKPSLASSLYYSKAPEVEALHEITLYKFSTSFTTPLCTTGDEGGKMRVWGGGCPEKRRFFLRRRRRCKRFNRRLSFCHFFFFQLWLRFVRVADSPSNELSAVLLRLTSPCYFKVCL